MPAPAGREEDTRQAKRYTVRTYSLYAGGTAAFCRVFIVSSSLSLSIASFGSAVWRADQLGCPLGTTVATGFPKLDAEFPGGGWPVGAISEILQAQNGQHEWRLLLPVLRRAASGPVALVGAPYMPFGPGLAALDFDARRLLLVDAATPSARLWAVEQTMRCAAVAATLAWLPQVRPEQLRRLQTVAHTHNKLLFVLRPAQAVAESSPAVLRILALTQQGSDALLVHILKRRGPPLEHPLSLRVGNARMAALMALTGERDALDCLATAA